MYVGKGKTRKNVNIGVGWLVGRDLSLCQLHCGLTTAATTTAAATAPPADYCSNWPKPGVMHTFQYSASTTVCTLQYLSFSTDSSVTKHTVQLAHQWLERV